MKWYLMHIFYYYCTPHFLCSCYLASHCNKKTVHLTIKIQTETIFAIAKLLKLTQLHTLNLCIYVSIRRNMQLCFRCLISLTLLHSIKTFSHLYDWLKMNSCNGFRNKTVHEAQRISFCVIIIITNAINDKFALIDY